MTRAWTRRRFLHVTSATLLASSVVVPVAAHAQSDDDAPFGAAEWMRIPRIDVDSHISDVGVTDGYYDVPWFDIGHHADSQAPGGLGNSIYNGHVVTVNAGEVFRRLEELVPGDAVYVYTADFRLDWVVEQVFSVADTDVSFLADTPAPRITLYTCTGQFNPVERSYAERRVVFGELVDTSSRT